jgi:hypothetical protein
MMRAWQRCCVLRAVAAAAFFQEGRVVVDVEATPSLVVAGCDKGGTSDAFLALLRNPNWASRRNPYCDGVSTAKDRKARDKCYTHSKELGCLYRGGTNESWARCYRSNRPVDAGKLWVDGTPNYLWGWKPATDVAARLRAFSPRTAVAVLLREPVARLRSLFNYWKTTPAGVGGELGETLAVHVLRPASSVRPPLRSSLA